MIAELHQRYIGLELLHDLVSDEGTLLLKRGTVLSEPLLRKINVSVDQLEYALQGASNKNKDNPIDLIEGAANEIRDIFEKFKKDKHALTQIESTVLPTVELLAREERLATLLEGLFDKDNYTYRHNIGVSVVASMLANWLHFSEEDRKKITLGGLLHDIGKLELSDGVLTKPGRLSNEEFAEIKMHPTYGYELLKIGSIYSEDICLMALEHHEREDGTGYPYQKGANEIHPFSKVIAIADVFHAMTSDRVYRKGHSLYAVLKHIKDESFGKLEPTYAAMFVTKFMELSIGQYAELSNGEVAEIVFIFPQDPINPLVRLHDELIELGKTNLYITKLIAS
ncbi:HD-GYP domain-containing protein [Halalkalibacter alkaliphilus]|uniref:HD-GYP domain-containing protein n=1 Tax=Halalkalibacter alkaliphilus TaxID=2917993 RepID=A0A9X2CSU8_9BACI|nr:HD-GYP domain-containing protein [Halalkalibacter alkaliphilus]MCL7747601.1 HD-GYP domain-containing protein [Halalkalibacter alkaliphilus]